MRNRNKSKICNDVVFAIFCLLIFSNCQRPKLETEQIHKIKSDFKIPELAYFSELAFKNELDRRAVRLSKWDQNIRIGITGEYTEGDSLEIVKILKELNAIIDPIQIEISSFGESNLKIYYIDQDEFVKFHRHAIVASAGYFCITRNFGKIKRAYILINKNLSGVERKSTLWNEISNSLGLINDSYRYPKSIYYQFMNRNIVYDDIDRKVIDLLYNYGLPPNLKGEDFKAYFLE